MPKIVEIQRKLEILEEWFTENKVWYDHDKIEVKVLTSSQYSGYSLGIVAKKGLKEEDLICRIPKSAVLSSRTCALAPLFEAQGPLKFPSFAEEDLEEEEEYMDQEKAGVLRLALCILFERSLGTASPWNDYFQTIPVREELPMFLDPLFVQGKGVTPLRSVEGTSLAVKLEEYKYQLLDDYEMYILPFIQQNGDDFCKLEQPVSFESFLNVVSLITSRAFFVDGYHGDCMVPLADM